MFPRLLPLVLAISISAEEKPAELKWENDAAKLEAAEKASPSPKGGVLFAGSSSVRLWKLSESFPGWPVINRGLGGSIVRENTPFIDRLIVPHAPRAIVFYAGDNDIASKRTPDDVAADFAGYVEKLRARLPGVKVFYLSIKPSLARWALWPKMQEANAKVRAFCEKTEGVGFIDIAPATLGADGKPEPALFQKDGLHLNSAGYAAWTRVVKERLAKELPELAERK